MGINWKSECTKITLGKMKTTLCLFLTIFVCSSWARPQYGGANQGFGGQQQQQGGRNPNRPTARPDFLPAGCRIEYTNVFSIQEREEYEDKCSTKYRQQCEQKFQRICNPYREKKCNTDYQRKCETYSKEECNQSWKDVQQAYQEDECNDSYVRKCEKHWEQSADGSKVWADDPATCKSLKETKCSPVTKYKTVREPYTKCDQVPYEDCRDVPYQDCQKVHKLVPHQVSKRRPFRVCGNDDPYEFTDAEINQFDIIGAGTRSSSIDSEDENDEEFNEENDVEEIDEIDALNRDNQQSTPKPKLSQSAITF